MKAIAVSLFAAGAALLLAGVASTPAAAKCTIVKDGQFNFVHTEGDCVLSVSYDPKGGGDGPNGGSTPPVRETRKDYCYYD
jgi:hypothetical protein